MDWEGMTVTRIGLKYALWALESMVLPPLCILLPLAVVSLIWAWRRQHPIRKRLWRPGHWLVLSHLLCVPVRTRYRSSPSTL